MFSDYLEADAAAGEQFGNVTTVVKQMIARVGQLEPARPGSLISRLDVAFADAPIGAVPSAILYNAIDHALWNLDYIGTVAALPDFQVSIPAFMSCIRMSLLSASHLAYVVSTGADNVDAITRMGDLYRVEKLSALKFIKGVNKTTVNEHGLPWFCPAADATISQLVAYEIQYPQASANLSETALLTELKDKTLAPLLARLNRKPATGEFLIDHLFNTTSGAAHGYAWVNLDGVHASFVDQLTVAHMLANIVFNDYLRALGQHPDGT